MRETNGRIAATRVADVPPGVELWPGSATAPCTRCGQAVVLSASSVAMIRAGDEPWCLHCVHQVEPDAIGIFHPGQRAELEEHGIPAPEDPVELRRYR